MAIDHQRILSGIGRARDIPVIASALIQAGNRARFARQGPYAQYGNVHPYPAGRMPETGGWGDNGYGSLRWARDLLVTPHPPASNLYPRLTGDAPLVDPKACATYAAGARQRLDAREARVLAQFGPVAGRGDQGQRE